MSKSKGNNRRAARWCTRHAAERALERHGLWLSPDDFRRMALAIVGAVAGDPQPSAWFVWGDALRELWDVDFDGSVLRVGYDPAFCCIMTVYPPEPSRTRAQRLAEARRQPSQEAAAEADASTRNPTEQQE